MHNVPVSCQKPLNEDEAGVCLYEASSSPSSDAVRPDAEGGAYPCIIHSMTHDIQRVFVLGNL